VRYAKNLKAKKITQKLCDMILIKKNKDNFLNEIENS
jgi:hypothetical protein